MAVWFAALGTGCEVDEVVPDPPAHPCHSDVARVEVSPPNGAYNDLEDGASLWFGRPPQGGAPFSPFRIRILGPDAFADGIELEMEVEQATDGAQLAYTTLPLGLTCANVGDSSGYWVSAEAHMRYEGWELDDLEAREGELVVRAWPTAGGDPLVESSWQVSLTRFSDSP